MENIIKVQRDELMSKGISYIKNSHILLDIGCGIRPHDYAHNDIYTVCEPYEEYVNVLKSAIEEIREPLYLDSCFLIINKDWRQYLDLYEDYSVDTVYLIDVIEHLPKEEGKELLRRTEKFVKQQIVIFTPLDYIEQKTSPDNKDAWGLAGASWQEHKSVWKPADFHGEEWLFVVCEDFHEYNNIGEKLEKPVGAFWAIKNVNGYDGKENILSNITIKEYYGKAIERVQKRRRDIFNEKVELLKENTKIKCQLECEINKLNDIQSTLNDIQSTKGYKCLTKFRRLRKKIEEIL